MSSLHEQEDNDQNDPTSSTLIPKAVSPQMRNLADLTSQHSSNHKGPPSRSLPSHLIGPSTKQTNQKQPYIIGISGGSASGKTSVCREIISRLQNARVVTVSQDSFYKPLTPQQLETAHTYNFDHPSAFDHRSTLKVLTELRNGDPSRGYITEIPHYDFTTHTRTENTTKIYLPADIIIFEGIMTFYNAEVRKLFDLKIFVDCDSDLRLLRRIKRDTKSRGRSVESILQQYETFVKPSFDEFIAPTHKYADIIIPRGASNKPAINLIVREISYQLKTRDFTSRSKISDIHDLSISLPPKSTKSASTSAATSPRQGFTTLSKI